MTTGSWLLLIVVIIVLAIVIWWWWTRRPKTASTMSTKAVPTVPVVDTRADDLTIVEGIGPKIAGLLQAAGIKTFAQLSATDTAKLSEILKAAHLQFSDPTTWPQQAALAAAGKMAELKVLQDSLNAGRKV
jgi:predicted flap endonuclease-1-like 5' DNA nuclease